MNVCDLIIHTSHGVNCYRNKPSYVNRRMWLCMHLLVVRVTDVNSYYLSYNKDYFVLLMYFIETCSHLRSKDFISICKPFKVPVLLICSHEKVVHIKPVPHFNPSPNF